MSFRVLCALFAASAIGACSLFSGLDGFTSAAPEGDAATPDATGTSDAGPSDGPGTDGSSSTNDGGPSTYCSTIADAALCEDFDDDMPLEGWTQTTNPNASFEVVSGGRSTPNAIRAAVMPSTDSRGAFISRTLGASVSHARLSYSLFVEQRPTINEIEVNLFRLIGCPNGCWSDFYVAINGVDSDFVEQSYDAGAIIANYHPLGAAIPTGKWVRIGFEVILTGTKEIVLTVDGVEIGRQEVTIVAPGTPTLNSGITYAAAKTNAASVLIDDVVFEQLP